MTNHLPLLTDEEVRPCSPPDPEAGFGALHTPKGLLPLKAMDVQTRIDGLLAQTTLCQTFLNPLDEPLEATYIFPLPDRAAVTAFRMEVAGRVVEGVLKERGEARRDYDQAIQSGKRAAITEEERPGVFTLRVGNLMPGETATIRLTLNGPLEYSEGEATFRFPLVVAPRYIPGKPLPGPSVGEGVAPDTDSVPDASRISPPVLLPGFPNPVQLSLAVEVRASGLTVRDLRSSLHALVMADGADCQRLSLQPGERLNRDFLLRFRVGEQTVHTSLVLQPDAGTESQEGTFLLTVVPPAGQAQTARPRDVVFVLDRSGSMGGWKMVAARRALARMVDTLTDRDQFAVYAFDDTIETVPAFGGAGLVPATNRNRFRAVEFLARIESRGGTEMAQPLDQAVRQLTGRDPQRDRILVLVTDGQVGNEDQILRTLGQRLTELRIFTLGIDKAVNAGFLKRLAGLGGGACELVESEDRLDEVMDKVHRRLGTPVLTGLRLEAAGIEVFSPSIVPARLPDLFAGTPLLVQGRYRGAAKGKVTVQARDAAGRPWTETAAAQVSDNPAITSVWARGYVRELEDRYVIANGTKDALEKQIVQASLRFSVLCRFTAFIAVDVKEVVNPDGKVHRVTQPVEPAAGWAMLGTQEPEKELLLMSCLAAPQAVSPLIAHGSSPDASAPPPPSSPAPASPSQARYYASKRARRGSSIHDILSKVAQAFGGRPKSDAAAQESIDLTAYRRRAGELLKRLQSAAGASAADRLTELGILVVQLAALLEDVKSTGIPPAAFQALEELLAGLQALLASDRPAEADIGGLWTQAERVLRIFGQVSGEAAPSTADRREGFWK
jgi:Ca-activated chloride channel family protein